MTLGSSFEARFRPSVPNYRPEVLGSPVDNFNDVNRDWKLAHAAPDPRDESAEALLKRVRTEREAIEKARLANTAHTPEQTIPGTIPDRRRRVSGGFSGVLAAAKSKILR